MLQKRLFIAVPLSADTKSQLASYIDMVRSQAKLQWSFPENLHLTLAFLGDTDELQVPVLERIIQETAKEAAAFTLAFEEMDAFPSLKKPRVLFIKPTQTLAITKLANTLRAKLADAKIEHDPKPFTPHLTVARNPYGITLPKLPSPPKLIVPIDKIVLYESRLTKPYATYDELISATI